MRSKRPWSETLLDSLRDASEPVREALPPQRPEDLPARNMHDSYSQIDLPFASSPSLLEQYVNAWGGIRTGKLMEHLDSLAGSIAYKHMLGPTAETVGKVKERGFYIVTAAVDRCVKGLPVEVQANKLTVHEGLTCSLTSIPSVISV